MSERWRLITEIWKKGRVDVGAVRLPHPIALVDWPEKEVDVVGVDERGDGEGEGEGEGEGGDDAAVGAVVEVIADL